MGVTGLRVDTGLWGYGVMGLWGYGVMGVMWVMGLYGVIRGYGVVFFTDTQVGWITTLMEPFQKGV